jgi:chemotaxis signal transduction protein
MSSESSESRNDTEYLLVRGGGHRCAIPVTALQLVTRALVVHPLPGSMPRLLGFAQAAGEPVAVLDLHALLDPEGNPGGTHRLTVIVQQQDGPATLGLAIDEAYGVAQLPVHEGPAADDTTVVAGRSSRDGRTILVLNLDRLFDPAEVA